MSIMQYEKFYIIIQMLAESGISKFQLAVSYLTQCMAGHFHPCLVGLKLPKSG